MSPRTAVLTTVILVAVALLGVFAFGALRGAGPAVLPPPVDISDWKSDPSTPGENKTDFPLTVADGFTIRVFAQVPNARVMTLGPEGTMWVSRTKDGIVSRFSMDETSDRVVEDMYTGLDNPHGLVFDLVDPNVLYIAEEERIVRVNVAEGGEPEAVVRLPEGGRHVTRTLFYGADNNLYVSIGSSCNVCNEADARLATIQKVNLETQSLEPVATGLRNSIFATVHPVTGDLWATDMGRDSLGDDLPPDEINIIREDGWYGWPWFYGKNVFDEDFADGVMPGFAKEAVPSHIDLPAHVAPMDIDFVPEEGWPEEYWYDALVAFHGSWDRDEPTGYMIARIPLDAEGNPEERDAQGNPLITPFVEGWLTEDERALGRPVDMLVFPGGTMYISDDKAGVIYAVQYRHDATVNSFEECVQAGYPVMESFPRQCREPGGRIFVELLPPSNEEKQDHIRVQFPRAGASVLSPLDVSGEARGTWYFEASFPVRVEDANGNELGVSHAQAQDEWMTTEFVPFQGTIHFTVPPEVQSGFVVFQKDNPSGLPEQADEVRVPVRFTHK